VTDDHDLTDGELLSMPGEDIPPGRLSEYFTRRSAVAYQRGMTELMLELSGNSGLRGMIFPDQDPRVKQQREEEERRRRQEYEQAIHEITAREDRLLVRIEEQQREIENRQKEIDERTIRLHDGRRAYVDGDGYVDGQGHDLRGADHDEARAEHAKSPNAATLQEKTEADRQWNELDKLKHDVQQHRQGRDQFDASADLKHEQETADDYEKRFQHATETRRAEIEAKPDSVADAYSADYMADYGRTTSYAKQQDGEGKILAGNFAPAAAGQPRPGEDKTPRPSTAPDITPA
jgi:hypothetical protein